MSSRGAASAASRYMLLSRDWCRAGLIQGAHVLPTCDQGSNAQSAGRYERRPMRFIELDLVAHCARDTLARPTSACCRFRKMSATYSGQDNRLASASISGMLGCAGLSWLLARDTSPAVNRSQCEMLAERSKAYASMMCKWCGCALKMPPCWVSAGRGAINLSASCVYKLMSEALCRFRFG